MVRPVIYRSRLYLLWAEQQIRKNRDGDDDIPSYTLKLTHIKYDGSWASPFSYDVTPKFSKLTGQDVGLYCAADYENDILSCIFYTKEKEDNLHQSTVIPKEYAGLHILADMEQTPFPGIESFIQTVIPQLDTVNISRINTTLENMNTPPLDPEEQQGSPDLALGLDLISCNLRKEDQKYILSVEPVVDVTINVSTIPEPLRALFADKYSGGNYALYEFTDTSFSSENPDIPGGKCSLHLLYDKVHSTSYIYLTLPSGNKQPDIIRYLTTALLNVGSTPSTGVFLQWEGSDDQYHYLSSRPVTTRNPIIKQNMTISGLGDTGNKDIGIIKTGIPELILSEDYPACPELRIIDGDTTVMEFTKSTIPNHPEVLSDGSFYFDSTFDRQTLDVTAFVKENQLNLPFKIDFKRFDNAKICGSRNYHLTMEVSADDSSAKTESAVISLYTTGDGAQYMEWDVYRTRLNTLFARQLIARANRGIDAVLSPETQNLREPKPGEGTYITLTLKPYDPAIHGSDRRFTIQRGYVIVTGDVYPVIDGTVSTETSTTVNLFIPHLGYNDDKIFLRAHFQSGDTNWIVFIPDGNGGWKPDTSYFDGTFPGLESVSGLSQPDEPMDFSGANALYFWELFYYTPMMVAMRLLQEQNFTEAHRWLSYIWRPAATAAGDWRVRPLLEDTTWNADPLDSVDPDAVAQNDPMHYKVSTIMKMLDLLIARGDSAYRMLERDTLNEAKMWYMQALGLLGDKPVTVISGNWGNPALSEAADDTREQQRHQAISALRHGGLVQERHSANTLTWLFLPQQNEKLLGYWQTLDMRLFNLRNNLAIDGQPLSLPIFAAPADPAALLSAAAAASGGSKALPSAAVPAMRFPQALESARSLTGQLMQFGATLQGLIERQDAEAMSELLQNQAGALMLSSLRMQEQALAELDAEKKTLEQSRAGAQSRFDSYRALYDENVSAAEQRTMDLYLSSSVLSTSAEALAMAEAVADMAPNVFGMAVGGSRWGGIPKAIGSGISLAASATKITADNISQSEAWRRRRQEWEIQKNSAESEVRQIDAQLDALTVRRTAAEMQREYLEIQQAQTQAQLEFLQRKFSNKALYSWLRGRLAAVYYRFCDLTTARCMMAEAAYGWQTGETTRYIKPGAWQSAHAGLMAGESLLLNLTEMEQAWLKWDHRALEVTRTVSLADVYSADKVDLAAKIAELLTGSGSGSTPAETGLSLTTDKQLHAAFNLKALNIAEDYPAGLGKTRRIRQISVTLPALTGPYQDVRAVLSYGGDVRLPDGCKAIAVSHGMNDSGQFQLDFSDGRWLPFEGIAVDNDSSLTLSFPEATEDEQKALLLSLSDIIVHIRYTIR